MCVIHHLHLHLHLPFRILKWLMKLFCKDNSSFVFYLAEVLGTELGPKEFFVQSLGNSVFTIPHCCFFLRDFNTVFSLPFLKLSNFTVEKYNTSANKCVFSNRSTWQKANFL